MRTARRPVVVRRAARWCVPSRLSVALTVMAVSVLASWTAAQEVAPPVEPTASPAAQEGTAAGSSSDPAPASRDAGAEPFEERISGTTVRFDLVPVRVPDADAHEDVGTPGAPARTLWFAAHELTWDAFDAFLYRLDKPDPMVEDDLDAVVRPSAAFVLADRGFGHDGYPAISLNHTAGTAFCEWLSAKTGRSYRLPTQAEWEAACLAGDGSWIDSSRDGLEPYAWVRQTADRKTHAVGSLAPNPAGLFDVLGNAAEWRVDPDGTAVLRGGSYQDRAQDVGAHTVAHPTPDWNATDPQIPKSRWWLADAPFAGVRIVCEDGPDAAR